VFDFSSQSELFTGTAFCWTFPDRNSKDSFTRRQSHRSPENCQHGRKHRANGAGQNWPTKSRRIFEELLPLLYKSQENPRNYNLPADQYEVMELDQLQDAKQGDAIQQYMKKLTGASSVRPNFRNFG